jgi:muramoyltetrapeptide carboxypeptidase
VDPEVYLRRGYLAGEDWQRAGHLSKLMSDPEVSAVLCVRGGFGTSRLLTLLDLERLAASGRCLIGSSDLTALLMPLAAEGLITLHGPMVTQLVRLDDPGREDMTRLLTGNLAWPSELVGRPLSYGLAQGPLLGGNLTLICHLMGTHFLPDLSGAILFFEEVNETPYRLDRLLTQLELAGVWDQVAGVAVGSLSDQEEDPVDLWEVLVRRLGRLSVPVMAGLPFGHGPRNRLLPQGALAELDAREGLLRVGLDLA